MSEAKKRVLFLTIPFREYIIKIKRAIEEELNADVDVVSTVWGAANTWGRFLGRGNGKRVGSALQSKKLEKLAGNAYDYIFVLVGRDINAEKFREFAKGQKNAKKILYLWDDVKRVADFDSISDIFDDIASFDRTDCEKMGFRFLPLFYTDDFRFRGEKKDIDVSCIGEYYPFRKQTVADIKSQLPDEKLRWYILLSAMRRHIIKEKLKCVDHSDGFVKPVRLGIAEVSEISRRSRIVIDAPNPSQHGLSLRTFEALASHSKLITTNADVERYDFYNSGNILIYRDGNTEIPESFLSQPYADVPDGIAEAYSLKNWVRRLFSVD